MLELYFEFLQVMVCSMEKQSLTDTNTLTKFKNILFNLLYIEK